ncbi:hypothetical protein BKH46_03905 [Helicobacter sp. 12S02634-8]|uniref:NFACT family protein n=1 Tax=Helicobacter sp. 12S02634-8 TaxID=1476199 RepID=UPI000BA70F0A|nr:NFACT family protein [Helicobacter sp. 12S02634-8]PAF47577.1 hypothetical protein BKH46_03905 [Helicobacter sp. 12S02634-8]
MKLWLLQNIARFLSSQESICHLKRIDDNLFKLTLKDQTLYMDMTKGDSGVFLTPYALMGAKKYNAPFDVMLTKLTTRAKITGACIDGGNRILKLSCLQNGAYKHTAFSVQFEFTGRHTNVILLDGGGVVLEALRHINGDKSSREVRVNKPLEPLPQPPFPKDQAGEVLCERALFVELNTIYTHRVQKHLEAKKHIAISKITKKIQKLKEALQALPQEEELATQASKLAQEANIVLANLDSIPNFSQTIALKDFSGLDVKINLPQGIKTPQEAANVMFTQAKKLTKKAKNTHLQVQNLTSKIDFLHQEIAYITNISTLEDLTILEPKKSHKKTPPKYEVFFIEGVKISMGRNRFENQDLLKEARADDIWLHIRDVPSSHMIIHCGKNKVFSEVIYKAGEILVGLGCVQAGDFMVDYTQRKFVKIIEGARVIYAKHQTFHYKKPFQG